MSTLTSEKRNLVEILAEFNKAGHISIGGYWTESKCKCIVADSFIWYYQIKIFFFFVRVEEVLNPHFTNCCDEVRMIQTDSSYTDHTKLHCAKWKGSRSFNLLVISFLANIHLFILMTKQTPPHTASISTNPWETCYILALCKKKVELLLS